MIDVGGGEHGPCPTLVRRVPGRGVQPRDHQRTRRTRYPFRLLAARTCRGREQVREFATTVRAAFPDLAFEGSAAELIAEGDVVVGQWIGGGTPDRCGLR